MQKVFHRLLTYDRVDKIGVCRLEYTYPDGLKPLESTGKELLLIDCIDLRNYGTQGVFEKVSAVIFGRARDYSPEEKDALDNAIKGIIAEEFEKPDLPIVTNMDFGHTDPQFILPLGVKAELDFQNKKFRLVEPWLE